jgi:hypothetical protein
MQHIRGNTGTRRSAWSRHSLHRRQGRSEPIAERRSWQSLDPEGDAKQPQRQRQSRHGQPIEGRPRAVAPGSAGTQAALPPQDKACGHHAEHGRVEQFPLIRRGKETNAARDAAPMPNRDSATGSAQQEATPKAARRPPAASAVLAASPCSRSRTLPGQDRSACIVIVPSCPLEPHQTQGGSPSWEREPIDSRDASSPYAAASTTRSS